jgi:ATP-dependent RNA helicase DeaD
VGAIANEAGIEGVHIGRIDIREDHTFVDLPGGMPKPVFKLLQTVLVLGRELRISRVDDAPDAERRPVVRGAATSGGKPARSVSARAAPARAAPVRPDRKMLTRRAPPTRGRKD